MSRTPTKYERLTAQVVALERQARNLAKITPPLTLTQEKERTEAVKTTDELIDRLKPKATGGKRYRELLDRARATLTAMQNIPAAPTVRDRLSDTRGVLPQGMTSSPELMGGFRTVSGGLPGTRR